LSAAGRNYLRLAADFVRRFPLDLGERSGPVAYVVDDYGHRRAAYNEGEVSGLLRANPGGTVERK